VGDYPWFSLVLVVPLNIFGHDFGKQPFYILLGRVDGTLRIKSRRIFKFSLNAHSKISEYVTRCITAPESLA
jgi:hypothetical protein